MAELRSVQKQISEQNAEVRNERYQQSVKFKKKIEVVFKNDFVEYSIAPTGNHILPTDASIDTSKIANQ